MSDLECTKCGMEASFADANIADARRTCGYDGAPDTVEADDGSTKYAWSGEKHDWREHE